MNLLTGSTALGTSLTDSAILGITGSSSYTSSSWHLLDLLSACFFIKGHIPADLNVMVTWYINPEGLRDLTVFHKYSLLSSRFQLVSLLFKNMYKY
jgi:hypothetical protein